MLLSQFPLIFHQTLKGMPRSIAKLLTILVLTGMVIVIILEMFHGNISLNSMVLLLVDFVTEFRLKLIYISLYISSQKLGSGDF